MRNLIPSLGNRTPKSRLDLGHAVKELSERERERDPGLFLWTTALELEPDWTNLARNAAHV